MNNYELITLSYDDAIRKHEFMVKKMIWLLRNSEFPDCDFPTNQITWVYSYYFRREDIIFNKELYERILKMTVEERLKEELKHIDVSLCMITPTFSILQRLKEVPEEVEMLFKKTVVQRMYIEQFFGFNEKDSIELSYPVKMDIWDEPKNEELTMEELLKKRQEAIDNENYEEAAKIQKQIDNNKNKPVEDDHIFPTEDDIYLK